MDAVAEGFLFIITFLVGIILLITGLFILVGGAGYVWYLAILYGLGTWVGAAILLYVAWLAFTGWFITDRAK